MNLFNLTTEIGFLSIKYFHANDDILQNGNEFQVLKAIRGKIKFTNKLVYVC